MEALWIDAWVGLIGDPPWRPLNTFQSNLPRGLEPGHMMRNTARARGFPRFPLNARADSESAGVIFCVGRSAPFFRLRVMARNRTRGWPAKSGSAAGWCEPVSWAGSNAGRMMYEPHSWIGTWSFG